MTNVACLGDGQLDGEALERAPREGVARCSVPGALGVDGEDRRRVALERPKRAAAVRQRAVRHHQLDRRVEERYVDRAANLTDSGCTRTRARPLRGAPIFRWRRWRPSKIGTFATATRGLLRRGDRCESWAGAAIATAADARLPPTRRDRGGGTGTRSCCCWLESSSPEARRRMETRASSSRLVPFGPQAQSFAALRNGATVARTLGAGLRVGSGPAVFDAGPNRTRLLGSVALPRPAGGGCLQTAAVRGCTEELRVG